MQDPPTVRRQPAGGAVFISRSFVNRGLAAVLLAGTVLGGYAAGHASLADPAPATTQATTAASGAIVPSATPHLIPDFSQLVAQVRPAVVSITVQMNPDAPKLPRHAAASLMATLRPTGRASS